MTFDNKAQKKCEFCGEGISADAGRCPYCGSIVEITYDNNRGSDEFYRDVDYIPIRKPDNHGSNPLSNGLKVLLTVVCTIIPGIGQLAGIIIAIALMDSEADSDRKSFGAALLAASLVMFVLACIGCFILVIAISASINQLNY